jgi:DNA-binding beta-propeller fold protein YncE
MRRRSTLLLAGALAIAALAVGCGTGFKLPTESKNRPGAASGTYERIATWTGLDNVADIYLTKSAVAAGEQLYLLFRTVGSDTGRVLAYSLATPTPFSYRFRGLMNPIALCGDATRLFVLDQGDTCLARTNPATGRCDTTGNSLLPPGNEWTNKVAYLDRYWRVREYFPDGDTVSSFTDTTVAWVQGIALDDQQRIYVAGLRILVTQNPENPFYYYRRFVWRIQRYVRGGGDPNMPGCPWQRDLAYSVDEGSGLGTVISPTGIDWSPAAGGALYIADTGNNRAQRRSDPPSADDYLMLDDDAGALIAPIDISADLAGFVYVIDGGHGSINRYEPAGQGLGQWVQRVDIEPSADGKYLQKPVAVAADSSQVYVADGGAGVVAIFRRRK